jgi:hypothetical protein
MPGCCSQGATREEALANIRELIPEYLAVESEQQTVGLWVSTFVAGSASRSASVIPPQTVC